jgi:CelD/BcsL family acetyltransferase involved in cellulose biosynthesis
VSEINSQQDQKINLQVVQGAEGISEFGKHWDDLFARTVDATPFLSRSWISTFIHEGRIKGTPLFILAWCEGKLVALFPLVVRKCLNANIAAPIGTGEASYHGMLLDPEYPSVVGLIADLIISKRIIDVYINTFLSASDTTANDLLTMLVQKGCFCRQTFKDPCHYIQLDCSFEEYLSKRMSSRSRHTLRRKERRLFRNADVRVDYYAGKQVTDEIMSRIAGVQEESWMKRRGVAVLGQRFYRKFLLTMAQAGLGCLWLMTIDGADAAFQYAYVAHKNLYFRWTAFKLKYESLSPGQSLMMHMIRDACHNDILSIDFGPGDAEYKRFWCTDHFDVNRAIAGRGLMGRLITICYYCVWQLKKIKYLHSSYRRVKSILRRFRLKAATL